MLRPFFSKRRRERLQWRSRSRCLCYSLNSAAESVRPREDFVARVEQHDGPIVNVESLPPQIRSRPALRHLPCRSGKRGRAAAGGSLSTCRLVDDETGVGSPEPVLLLQPLQASLCVGRSIPLYHLYPLLQRMTSLFAQVPDDRLRHGHSRMN